MSLFDNLKMTGLPVVGLSESVEIRPATGHVTWHTSQIGILYRVDWSITPSRTQENQANDIVYTFDPSVSTHKDRLDSITFSVFEIAALFKVMQSIKIDPSLPEWVSDGLESALQKINQISG